MDKVCRILFYAMWSMIGIISALDLFLALRFLDPACMDTLRSQEKNPIVVKMIELSGDMSFFTICKVFGTLTALFVVRKIFLHNRKWGLSIVSGMFIFQVCLLFYLLFWTG
jgi:hypothetical protein